MLYRELKTIMEADEVATEEPKLDADGNPIVEPKKKASKTKKQKDLEKETSDGIGNDRTDAADKLAEFLGKNLKSHYPQIGDIEAEKAIVTISNAAVLMTEDTNFVPSLLGFIKASMGEDMEKYAIDADSFTIIDKDIGIVFA